MALYKNGAMRSVYKNGAMRSVYKNGVLVVDSRAAGPPAQTFLSSELPQHTYDGGDTGLVRWQPGEQVAAITEDPAGSTRLTRFQLNGNGTLDQCRMTLSAGGELAPAWEQLAGAITVSVPGLSDLVLNGPDHADNASRDSSGRAYTFSPGAASISYTTLGGATATTIQEWVVDFNTTYNADTAVRATLLLLLP